MSIRPFYITTTLPYVNAEPHIGFAMEIIEADIIARWKKLLGYEVFFNTGTDEHGQKVFQAAGSVGKTPEVYTKELAEKYKNLKTLLGLSEDLHFIRTTDEHHVKAAQEFWIKCQANGDIYKKNYKIKYCVGCELEKTDSELVDGRCPIHPDREIEIIEEENYFFKFSKYQPQLIEFYSKNPSFVIPDFRFNEIKKFVERGLEDFSISRLASKMSWGVTVPDDPNHVMFVWFDALINYISTLGWPQDKTNNFEKFWVVGETVQFAGKDQIRQQAGMWQAMLMSAGLPPTDKIVIHGFINFGGEKMSKSFGNVVSPHDVINEFGTEALRYFVARELNQFEDTDITMEKFMDAYNANLANGLGNLVSRIMRMVENYLPTPVSIPEKTIPENFIEALNAFEIQKAANIIWEKIGELDRRIQETEPFKLVKENKEKAVEIISSLAVDLYTIGRMLNPILPETSSTIKNLVKSNRAPSAPLFVRKD
ncbi:methionine--tRNA ligase [Patescibacteria group bacterium]|nr:MAG: methionine--tRNA ligase [Patescibacteria group bacterium]